MTVTITAKHDLLQTDDNDNETCCTDDKQYCDHTESLLDDLNRDEEETNTLSCRKREQITKVKGPDVVHYHRKARRLLCFDDAPEYMKHNCYIRSGYRGLLNTQLCFESLFWLTNETINIWSHLFGFFLFLALSVRDIMGVDMQAHFGDKFIVATVLICFQVCMFLSALYHTFSCRSEKDCDMFLSFDLFGIALSLLAIYTSGIYYAFWCDLGWQRFYLVTITVIFLLAMSLQIPSLNVNSHVKMLVFVGWAAYGILPTLHWTIYMGGFENPIVALLFPRVIGMYTISGIAFLIYITKIPERFYSGKFDYFGHSHQWWHLFVVGALYYWHNSGIIYLEYRFNHACASHMTIM